MNAYEVMMTIAVCGLSTAVAWCGIQMARHRDQLEEAHDTARMYKRYLDEDQAIRLHARENGKLARHLDLAAVCLNVIAEEGSAARDRDTARVYLEMVCSARSWAQKGGRSVEDPPAPAPRSDMPE